MSGDDGGPAGPTAEDFADLRQGLNDLADSFAELRAATTPAEKKAARADVDDDVEDLETTARRLGVSKAKLEESIAAAKNAERKEELRPLLAELLDELLDDDEPDPDDKGEPAAKPKPKAKAKAKAPAKKAEPDDDDSTPPPPADDTEPLREHWSERGVSGLLR